MEHLLDAWSLLVVLLAAFVIGWGAETAQTFLSRSLALTILAWLQTAPEFAVEAAIAWDQQRDLMIANLTGSLRLLVGLGWPMIFFVHFFYQGMRKRKFIPAILLEGEDSLGVLFLFVSVLYFLIVLAKGTLTCWDSVWLCLIYLVYLVLSARLPPQDVEDHSELPWIGRKIVKLKRWPRMLATFGLFFIGGVALYVSVHPFLDTLQRWSVTLGISTFVFVQWVAPFLSEFPEKVTAFNWARQTSKAPMAVMNMVNSNVNQWTMLAAMIPVVFNLSLGRWEPVTLDLMHRNELALTIAQSFLGGLLLLDLEFTLLEATALGALWLVQFVNAGLREPVTWIYVVWSAVEMLKLGFRYLTRKVPPRAFIEVAQLPIFVRARAS